MAKRKTNIEIDGRALRDAILKRGLHLTVVSEELGYSASTISNHIKGNYTTNAVAIALEKFYGISRDEYVPVEPTPEEVQEKEKAEHDAEEAKKVIYNAVYNGVYHALTDVISASGLKDALNELKGVIDELKGVLD